MAASVPPGPHHSSGPHSSPVQPLIAALAELGDASDRLTRAVERRDLAGVIAACRDAELVTARIDAFAARLTDADAPALGAAGLPALSARIGAAARRNALLIERAWALDAATFRLIGNLVGGLPGGVASRYRSGRPAVYLERQA